MMRKPSVDLCIFVMSLIETILASILISALITGLLSFLFLENQFNLDTFSNGIFIRLFSLGFIIILGLFWYHNFDNGDSLNLCEDMLDRVPRILYLIGNELDVYVRSLKYLSVDGRQHRPNVYACAGFFGGIARNERSFKSAFNEGLPVYSFDGDIADPQSDDFKASLQQHKGGIIVFVSEVKTDSVLSSTATVLKKVRKLFRQFCTFKKMLKKKKLLKLARKLTKGKEQVGGDYIGRFSIGKFFFGKFLDRDTEEVFNETSAGIEILGVPSSALILLTAEIVKEFKQKVVLVRDFNLDRFYLVSSKKVIDELNL